MKKIFTLVLMGAVAFGANAQKALDGNKFFDNWSIGLNAGGAMPVKDAAFNKVRPTFGVELSKQITPVVGLGVQALGALDVMNGNECDVLNTSLLGKINLMNLFGGYKGSPRLFEMEAVGGIGFMFFNDCDAESFALSTKYGFNFNFNVGEKKRWTVALKPSIFYNLDMYSSGKMHGQHNINRAGVEFLVGAAYHFKCSNGKHHFGLVRPYDQAEVDGLNAKINDLRNTVADKDAQLAKSAAATRALQHALNAERNKKPVEKIVEVQKVTVSRTQQLESIVTFRQGKSVVDASQLPNVERIATYMKNHKNAKVDIRGYASPEGSAEINARIAKARAEAVKSILVNKYKISAERISAEGQGVGDMFSEPDWNRVSICTIDDTK